MAAWLVVLALYAVTGGVAPAYADKLPTVTSVTPSSGPGTGGTLVTIRGTKLAAVRAVKFGSTDATSFTLKSPTSLTATSPAGAGTVDVTVTIPAGRSSATSSADHFNYTPTVTGVSPNTGPPAGGTPVTITGSGFVVGKSATHITFGVEELPAAEAVGVNCTTTTECTATAPELSPVVAEESGNIVDVTATVNNVESARTPADQFAYHGLYLVRGRNERIRVGESVNLRGFVGGREIDECAAFLNGRIASNGEATDVIDISPDFFASESCETNFFGDLPFSFALRLGDDGSATIEGPMGERTNFGCVYEGNRLTGGFETGRGYPLAVGLGGTFTLVAEEEPGGECAATEAVFMEVATKTSPPETEVIG